jgi:hypothetical protein
MKAKIEKTPMFAPISINTEFSSKRNSGISLGK